MTEPAPSDPIERGRTPRALPTTTSSGRIDDSSSSDVAYCLRPMKRPSTSKPSGATAERQRRQFDERDRQIREVAQRLLLERGLHGFSMDDVAAAIEYSKGTVYQHYTSKEDALVASCVASGADLAVAFERADAYPGRPRERMAAIAESYCHFVGKNLEMFRTIPLMHSPTVLEKVAPKRLAAMAANQSRLLGLCGGIVRDGIACGDLTLPRGLASETVTFALWSMMFGSFMLTEFKKPRGPLGRIDPAEAIRVNWAVYMDGLHWRPTSKAWDYAAARRRIRETLFAEGARTATGERHVFKARPGAGKGVA
jgi:AcrR family transcriptional regulator